MRIRRVVTTREGGGSTAPYASFNLGLHVGDDSAAVQANRQRLAEGVGRPVSEFVWMEQVHGTNVEFVGEAGNLAATDGVVTGTPGLVLAVLVADCVPVLLADQEAGVVAAVHAGRVGARDGVLSAAVEQMTKAGAQAERIDVLLGPSVCGPCYEVPADMADEVEAALPGSRCKTAKGTPGLDLRAGLFRQLTDAGITRIGIDPRCTVEDPTLFSHRRERVTGRQAAVIWMEAP
ncbi:peptidoglycan editing factor PgeF [Pseudonocardiaceae bacterium YIM PH 21723]|nr:peptidoglycan editing factor PgeF [Pseudonocardiaceae bacterium YIM PH 21723]